MTNASRRTVAALIFSCGSAVACLDASQINQPELFITPGIPAGWAGSSSAGGIGTTATDRKSGAVAAYLSSAGQINSPTYVLSQFIRADNYRGKRVRLSAWMKPRNVSNFFSSGLWMRVDGPGTTLGFDNMASRPVVGFGDWRKVSIVLDVPVEAIGIAFGATFRASNTLLIDEVVLEIVNTDIATTNTLTAPTTANTDSAATVATYERQSTVPVNLGFEGVDPVAQGTIDWLAQNRVELTTTDPTAALTDLEPLRTMVGSAQLVGLGEGTHGTKEFFQLKHRMLRFLVSQMGFTTFAIEATAPEADDLNHYVLTGAGDPAKLLSRLYFWTWNTQEVLDQILWMRQWNSTAPANQRVRFRGFDIQAPGASIDSVAAFLHRIDPQLDALIASKYQCLDSFRNNGPIPGRPRSEYSTQAAHQIVSCAEAVADARSLVQVRGEGRPGYSNAEQYARMVQQFERMAATNNAAVSNRRRDSSMAENIEWIKGQAGPDAKVVVWAHNAHVSRQSGTMGRYLQTRYGADYRTVGFAFGQGRFNAVLQLPDDTFLLPQVHAVTFVAAQSLEETFLKTSAEIALIDMRRTITGGAAAAPLIASMTMRSIGSAFKTGNDAAYFQKQFFPADFDLLMFVRTSTPTTLRAAVY